MKTLNEFLLSEKFEVYHAKDHEKKKQHAKHVHQMVQRAYKSIGGIHGSGFKDHHDMVHHIDTWKVHKDHTGKIRAVGLYKNKNGKSKRVAVATDGTHHGKRGLSHIVKHDLHNKRAHVETSGPSLRFHRRVHGDAIHHHALTHSEVKRKLKGKEIRKPPHDDPEVKAHPDLKKHFYQRKIGDKWHTKIMLGK